MSIEHEIMPMALVTRLRAALGEDGVVTEPSDLEPYLVEELQLARSEAKVALLPRSTVEVSEAVRICSNAGVAVVPQGGNTGLMGGAIAGQDEILISLRRMDKIISVDPVNFTMEVEAGAILKSVHDAAEKENCIFPLSLGSEGSCEIGGNIACNAGGSNVVRYGNTRNLVLGLEVVLPDGRIWNGLRRLRKDNAGYALREIFIGSEGTLGIITRAILRLFPQATDRQVAFCGVTDVDDALRLLAMIKARAAGAVEAFELISHLSLELSCKYCGISNPLGESYSWYVLVELVGNKSDGSLRDNQAAILMDAIDEGVVTNAVISESIEQANVLWRLRESIPEAEKSENAHIKHDISLPTSKFESFLNETGDAIRNVLAGTRFCTFGHLGDGNLHYNLLAPIGMTPGEFVQYSGKLTNTIYDSVFKFDGSIAAEHGVGLRKVDILPRYKDAVELELMQKIKSAIDPNYIMNPGKVVPINGVTDS